MSGSGQIILLNGPGSVGKSSIARELQKILGQPYLHLQMDTYLEMLPPDLLDHVDGLRFLPVSGSNPPEIEIRVGSVVQRLLTGMRQGIAVMARAGNNIVVDDVLLGEAADDYRTALDGLNVTWIGVRAPLEIVEERERKRGDRMLGLARWQFDRIEKGITYDLVVEADIATPAASAQRIKLFLDEQVQRQRSIAPKHR